MKLYVGRGRTRGGDEEQRREKETRPRHKKESGIGAKDYLHIPLPTHSVDRAPWVSDDTLALQHNPLLMLHQEVIDYVQFVSLSPAECADRQSTYTEVSAAVHRLWTDVETTLYGSSALALNLQSSDIDVSLSFPGDVEGASVQRLEKLEAYLAESGYEMELIRTARVPVLRLMRVKGRFLVEVSVNKHSASEEWTEKGLKQHPEARYLILVLKSFLRQRGLNDTYSGGFGSFLLYQLVLFSLKTHPAYTTDQVHYAGYTLAHYLIHFLKLFGQDFEYQSRGIRVGTWSTFTRNAAQWPTDSKFVVECPIEPGTNIAKGVFRLETVRRAFNCAFQALCSKTFEGLKETPLRCLIRWENAS